MQIENLVTISFTGDELKESLLCSLEHEVNNFDPGTKAYNRRVKIIEHIRNETCTMEWVNGKFLLSADGICISEPF